MANSEKSLDAIEAQNSTVVSNDQRRRRCFPMYLVTDCIRTTNSVNTLQRGGEGTHTRETRRLKFHNLILSQFLEATGTSVQMTPETFSAVSEGNYRFLAHMACVTSDQGDSILHLAAAKGHFQLVESVLSVSPSLFLKPNHKNQLPIHVAAQTGCLDVVEALVALVTFVVPRLSDEERERLNVYVFKDRYGDTALHLALKGRHMKTATCLVNEDQRASFIENEDGISPLILAVEAGDVQLVRAMLNTTLNDGLQGRKFLLHTTLKTKNIDILDVILTKYPSLVDEQDEKGRTCLLLAASIGFYEGVCNVLQRSTKTVYVCDNEGSFPIHMAVEKGPLKVAQAILTRCPDSKHLLNKHGQNLLHIASSKNWRMASALMFYFSETGWRNQMVEKQDVDGNTPLHLATLKWRPSTIVYILSFSLPTNCMYIRNKKGLTALDILESTLQPTYIFMERVTLMVLLFFYEIKPRDSICATLRKTITRPSYPPAGEKNKEYVNTLLVVAALVATVTFAAGFTIPGGFNSDGSKLGMATLANDPKLFCFMVFDTLAMQSSVLTIATLIWAQLGDPTLVYRSLNVALPLLFFALLCMSVAFYCGVLAVFAHVLALVVFFSITLVIFLILMLFVLGPHVILHIPGIPLLFAMFFLQFVVLVEEDRDEQTSAAKSSNEQTSRAEISGKEAPTAESSGKEAPTAEISGKDASTAESSGKEAPTAEISGKEASTAESSGKDLVEKQESI